MKVYCRADNHLICGHWNGSPVEIGVADVIKNIPAGEVYHHHAYHEYYVILEGGAELLVEGDKVPM